MAWNTYIDGLSHAGIHLRQGPDTLAWLYNKKSGKVTARLAYELIASLSLTELANRYLEQIWKFNFPLKIICFSWLCFNNSINTWDNLLRKGWVGPNYCCLCLSSAKSIDHLFSECRFTKNIIAGLNSAFDRSIQWNEPTFTQNWVNWYKNKRVFLYLPLLKSWQVWIAKNKYIFQDLCTYPKHVIVKILEMPKAHAMPILQNSIRRLTTPAPSF